MADVLGYDVYRCLLEDGDGEGTEFRPEAGKALYYVKVPCTRVDVVRALSRQGFCVVDVNVVFERVPDPDPVPLPPAVHPVEAEEAEDILSIAEHGFVYSRFHLDPRVPDRVANGLKRHWVQSYLDGSRGDRLLVVTIDRRPAGFLAELSLVCDGRTIRVIDLIAVGESFRGRGAGRRLVEAFVHDAQAADVLRVGTQVANVPSVRLYETCGFRFASSSYVLHAHVGDEE
jgi:ribosomal protein S18 acetylase RimI-like enzyme